MFKQLVFALVLVVLLSLLAMPAAFGLDEPVGSCPITFSLEMAMHPENHDHHHAGTHADRNGDGYICMKPVGLDNNIHVHIDNNLPR
jgi:hypothetical protein